jgi:hypothetical protein
MVNPLTTTGRVQTTKSRIRKQSSSNVEYSPTVKKMRFALSTSGLDELANQPERIRPLSIPVSFPHFPPFPALRKISFPSFCFPAPTRTLSLREKLEILKADCHKMRNLFSKLDDGSDSAFITAYKEAVKMRSSRSYPPMNSFFHSSVINLFNSLAFRVSKTARKVIKSIVQKKDHVPLDLQIAMKSQSFIETKHLKLLIELIKNDSVFALVLSEHLDPNL